MNTLKQLKEQLTSFEAACKIQSIDPDRVTAPFDLLPKQLIKPLRAHAKWMILVAAANQIANNGKPWTPDFNNPNEWKYEIWWEMSSSGFRYCAYGCWTTNSYVGSRLCFINEEVAQYLAETFPEIWNEYAL